jgi:hypothetical protein
VALLSLTYLFAHDEHTWDAAMTKLFHLTGCAIILASLAICGTVFANWMWSSQATAAAASPGIEITSLMSNMDATKLPVHDIADLF